MKVGEKVGGNVGAKVGGVVGTRVVLQELAPSAEY